MKRLLPFGWLAFAVLLVLVVSKIDYITAMQSEIEQQKKAWNAMRHAEGEGSCGVLNNGPEITCQLVNGKLVTKLAPDPDRCPPRVRRLRRNSTGETR